MENFLAAQTIFGISALVSFLCLLYIQIRCRNITIYTRLLVCTLNATPLVLYAIAAIIQLNDVRNILGSDISDIVNPNAGIQISMELILQGGVLTFILSVISIYQILKKNI